MQMIPTQILSKTGVSEFYKFPEHLELKTDCFLGHLEVLFEEFHNLYKSPERFFLISIPDI